MLSTAFLVNSLCFVSVVLGSGLERRAAASSSKLVCNSDNLLRALQHRTPDSYSFCSSYISQPSTTTTTDTFLTNTYTYQPSTDYYLHPQELFNLQRFSSDPTPLIYTNQALPSTVSGGAQNYPPYQRGRRDVPEPSALGSVATTPEAATKTLQLLARATTTFQAATTTSSVPAYLATYPPSRISSGCTCLSVPYMYTETKYTTADTTVTESTTCTYFETFAVTAVPSICNHIDQLNAPAVQTGVANVTTVSKFGSPDKLSCCFSCINVFNCLWWKFDFAKPAADGTGDPWSPGKCQFAFFTGNSPDAGLPAVCPNGGMDLTLGKESNGPGNLRDPGYNQGACGGAPGPFQSSEDSGYPEDFDPNSECGC